MQAGSVMRRVAGTPLGRAAAVIHRHAPKTAKSLLASLETPAVNADDIRRRLAYARHTLEALDCIVAPSRTLAEEFVRLGAPPDRLHVSDYGFRPMTGCGDRAARDTEPLRMGFVGTLVWHKGIHVLIDAARGLVGRFEIHLHGDTNVFPDYVRELRNRAAGLPITFDGPFDRDRVRAVYDGLDVLVVPSLWPENSPLVIHEAFMRHVPVVGSRIGGIPDLIVDQVSGLLYDPFSVEALQRVLQRLIDDRSLVGELSARAPHVKTIEEDALEWQARYRALLTPSRDLARAL
jgi:glycosyltransferase involved in cell wall biosynthesis